MSSTEEEHNKDANGSGHQLVMYHAFDTKILLEEEGQTKGETVHKETIPRGTKGQLPVDIFHPDAEAKDKKLNGKDKDTAKHLRMYTDTCYLDSCGRLSMEECIFYLAKEEDSNDISEEEDDDSNDENLPPLEDLK